MYYFTVQKYSFSRKYLDICNNLTFFWKTAAPRKHKKIVTLQHIMKKRILSAMLLAIVVTACNLREVNHQDNKDMNTTLTLTQEWDKVFPLSEKVNHRKVTFENQYGLTLAADLYTPIRGLGNPSSSRLGDDQTTRQQNDQTTKYPAIAVSGPFGACKEQSSGLYAMRMAERGFVTLAFDPSYTGESSGEPRRTASP